MQTMAMYYVYLAYSQYQIINDLYLCPYQASSLPTIFALDDLTHLLASLQSHERYEYAQPKGTILVAGKSIKTKQSLL